MEAEAASMEREYVAAIDQGTTGTRLALFRKDGALAAFSYREHTQIHPRPGWVEHDPLEIWENVQLATKDALAISNIAPEEIAAIGVTNQRETTIIWDLVTGKPYCNAVVWQCTRTSQVCEELEKRVHVESIRERTGLPVSTYFSGPKIRWILDNIPEAGEAPRKGRAAFGTMDTWIIWNLTVGVEGGSHVTDYSNASRTMLMDLRRLRWDGEMLDMLSIPSGILPTICPSSDREPYGWTPKGAYFISRSL